MIDRFIVLAAVVVVVSGLVCFLAAHLSRHRPRPHHPAVLTQMRERAKRGPKVLPPPPKPTRRAKPPARRR